MMRQFVVTRNDMGAGTPEGADLTSVGPFVPQP